MGSGDEQAAAWLVRDFEPVVRLLLTINRDESRPKCA
jgi:hypothetical protein